MRIFLFEHTLHESIEVCMVVSKRELQRELDASFAVRHVMSELIDTIIDTITKDFINSGRLDAMIKEEIQRVVVNEIKSQVEDRVNEFFGDDE